MVGYVEMSVGYSNAGAFGGDGSCAVCVVAGGSVGCGHCTCLSANDAEAAVFVEYEGADLGCGAVVAVAASGKRRSSEFGFERGEVCALGLIVSRGLSLRRWCM